MEKPKIVYFNFRSEKNARCHYLHKIGNVLITFLKPKNRRQIGINQLKIVIRIKPNFEVFFSVIRKQKSKICRKYIKNNKTNKGILSSL